MNMSVFRKKSAIIVLLITFFPILSQARTEEYNIKAVFLERFTRFIEWPKGSTLSDKTQKFILGVIGKNPFRSSLEEIYSSQKIKNKEVEIRYISSADKINGCHLLFISKSMKKQIPYILSSTRVTPILTVGDTEGYGDEGVHINFYIEEGKIRFEINESAIRTSGLYVSHLLLRTAKVIKPLGEKK